MTRFLFWKLMKLLAHRPDRPEKCWLYTTADTPKQGLDDESGERMKKEEIREDLNADLEKTLNFLDKRMDERADFQNADREALQAIDGLVDHESDMTRRYAKVAFEKQKDLLQKFFGGRDFNPNDETGELFYELNREFQEIVSEANNAQLKKKVELLDEIAREAGELSEKIETQEERRTLHVTGTDGKEILIPEGLADDGELNTQKVTPHKNIVDAYEATVEGKKVVFYKVNDGYTTEVPKNLQYRESVSLDNAQINFLTNDNGEIVSDDAPKSTVGKTTVWEKAGVFLWKEKGSWKGSKEKPTADYFLAQELAEWKSKKTAPAAPTSLNETEKAEWNESVKILSNLDLDGLRQYGILSAGAETLGDFNLYELNAAGTGFVAIEKYQAALGFNNSEIEGYKKEDIASGRVDEKTKEIDNRIKAKQKEPVSNDKPDKTKSFEQAKTEVWAEVERADVENKHAALVEAATKSLDDLPSLANDYSNVDELRQKINAAEGSLDALEGFESALNSKHKDPKKNIDDTALKTARENLQIGEWGRKGWENPREKVLSGEKNIVFQIKDLKNLPTKGNFPNENNSYFKYEVEGKTFRFYSNDRAFDGKKMMSRQEALDQINFSKNSVDAGTPEKNAKSVEGVNLKIDKRFVKSVSIDRNSGHEEKGKKYHSYKIKISENSYEYIHVSDQGGLSPRDENKDFTIENGIITLKPQLRFNKIWDEVIYATEGLDIGSSNWDDIKDVSKKILEEAIHSFEKRQKEHPNETKADSYKEIKYEINSSVKDLGLYDFLDLVRWSDTEKGKEFQRLPVIKTLKEYVNHLAGTKNLDYS